MFSFSRPTQPFVQAMLEAARRSPVSYSRLIDTRAGLAGIRVPPGYAMDRARCEIGRGPEAFAAARAALGRWEQFNLGWVRVANPEAKIETGEMVAVQAHGLGLWSINVSRILYVIDEPARFGFAYGTTELHVERGEERFLLEIDQDSGAVFYDLLAVSQPAHWLARLGFPYTRSRQRRFARESSRRMQTLEPDPQRLEPPVN